MFVQYLVDSDQKKIKIQLSDPLLKNTGLHSSSALTVLDSLQLIQVLIMGNTGKKVAAEM